MFIYISLIVSDKTMSAPMSHEECLQLVCAICTNLNGIKADQPVSETDAILIKKYVFPGFQRGSIWFPQGVCVRCRCEIRVLDQQIEAFNNEGDLAENLSRKRILKLPEDYLCDLPMQTRGQAGQICSCRWCSLARLSGGKLRSWRSKLKRGEMPQITHICRDCGKGVPTSVKSHKCNASDKERVIALAQSIPKDVRAKLVTELLREQQKENINPNIIHLPQPSGGRATQIQIGKVVKPSALQPLTMKEVQVMSGKAHLTGAQQTSILADLRVKFGRNVVEPGLKQALPEHNRKFENYFTVKKKTFETSDGVLMEKPLFFCHSPEEFLLEVDRERGLEMEDQITLIQGDSGQGYTKICASRISIKDLQKEELSRTYGAGYSCMGGDGENGRARKRRRSREDGVEGGDQFESWGSRKILLLAVVHKVPETAYNLETIFSAIKIKNLKFRFTGDFAFFMPSLGLLKGCSSCNPCPYCDQERSKEGGGKARWVEGTDTNLRTFGSLLGNYAAWSLDGERTEAAQTKKWKSVTGPVLVMGQGDKQDTFILDKVVPGPLHLYLSVNEMINNCEKTCWPLLKSVLAEIVGVQVHVYQGKVGNYEGPSINKIFKKLSLLEHFKVDEDKRMYLEALSAFKTVSESVFGKQLHPLWREHLHNLKAHMDVLSRVHKMPITPKFHVLTVHVEQWVDRNMRAMGREGESPGEAFHHTWKRLVEGKGEVKDKESDNFVKSTFHSLLQVNADNV